MTNENNNNNINNNNNDKLFSQDSLLGIISKLRKILEQKDKTIEMLEKPVAELTDEE